MGGGRAGSGDGFVRCTCGHRHWGRFGAAGLLLCDPGRGVLLQRRAWWTHHGRTWSLPGGAVHAGETPVGAAVREAGEEAAIAASAIRPLCSSTVDHEVWRYTTVLAAPLRELNETVANAESDRLCWVPPAEVAGFALHPDFAAAWPGLRAQLGRGLTLVVDAANVVGSRPDGWWRDRAGAAARLRDRLAGLAADGVPGARLELAGEAAGWHWWPRIVLVVEGKASGVAETTGVEVVAAPTDGDTTIVEVTASARAGRPDDQLLVVTADRELRGRVGALGAAVLGPSALLALLDG